MGFEILKNMILVEEIEPQNRTKMGVMLPEGSQDNRIVQGKVIAVGEGEFNKYQDNFIEIKLEKDDVVYYAKHYAMDVPGENKKLKLVDMNGVFVKGLIA